MSKAALCRLVVTSYKLPDIELLFFACECTNGQKCERQNCIRSSSPGTRFGTVSLPLLVHFFRPIRTTSSCHVCMYVMCALLCVSVQAVQSMMEYANKAIRDQVRMALDYIIKRETSGGKARK